MNKKIFLFFVLSHMFLSKCGVKCTDLDKNAWFFQLLFISLHPNRNQQTQWYGQINWTRT